MAYDENIYARIVSGELTESEKSALKESGEWEEIQSILKASSELSLPEYNKSEGYSKLKNEKKRRKNLGTLRKLYLLTGSVAAILIIVLGYTFLFSTNNDSITAPSGEIADFVLSDNTRVKLNDRSTLDFEGFDKGELRHVELIGEGYFEVAKGSEFTVSTSIGNVTVLGTAFNIRSWDGIFEVECYEGSVLVRSNTEEEVLTEGEAVALKNSTFDAYEVKANDKPSWISGRSRFSNIPVSKVFKEMERQYGVQVHFEATDKSFSGIFQHKNLRNALDEICQPLGLSFQISNDKVVTIRD